MPFKYAALGMLLVLGSAMPPAGAIADTFGSRCFRDRCFAVRCNDQGEDCRRVKPYDRAYYRRAPHFARHNIVCEAGSDRCVRERVLSHRQPR